MVSNVIVIAKMQTKVKNILRIEGSNNIWEYACLLAVFGLPFFIWFGNIGVSIALRAGVLVAALAVVVLVPRLRAAFIEGLDRLPLLPRLAVLGLMMSMVIATFLSYESPAQKLIGLPGENLGLFVWLSFIVLGIVGHQYFTSSFLKSKMLLYLLIAVLFGTIITHMQVIVQGERPLGLLLHSTAQGVYAVGILAVAFWHLFFTKLKSRQMVLFLSAVIGASGLLIVASQSRLAQIALVTVCLIYSVYLVAQKRRAAIIPVVVAAICMLTVLVWPNGASRFYGGELATGASYRLDIYAAALQDALRVDRPYGTGPSASPAYLNDTGTVSPQIVESLREGGVFLSAHTIVLDIAIYFGLLGGLCFLVLLAYALFKIIRGKWTSKRVLLTSFFTVVLFNGLLNVPSVEMTSLLFLTLFAIISES